MAVANKHSPDQPMAARRFGRARGSGRAASRARQRGLTLFGLLSWALAVAFIAYLLLRVLPTINEYSTIMRAIDKVAKSQPTTVQEARQAFDKQKDLEYSISSIAGKDLVVTKENDKVVISFAYDNVIPIYGWVNVLIKYEGSSR